MRLRMVAALAGASAVILALVTWYALEGREVVVLRTMDANGSVRETRVWVAEADGALWIEAATPERPFYRDLTERRTVELLRGGHRLVLDATPVPGPDGHARIRTLLHRRYGWADDWIGWLQDTSRSVAIRLDAPRSPSD